MRTLALFFVLMILFEASANANHACLQKLERISSSNTTTNFLAYLTRLIEQKLIGPDEITLMINGLNKKELTNPISPAQAETDSTAQVHRGEIDRYFKASIDKTELLAWLETSQKELQRVTAARSDAKQETHFDYSQIEFVTIPPGVVKHVARLILIRDRDQFEMMSTPVTQKQWVDIMGQNPSHFTNGEHSVSYPLNGSLINMQPDNPVEKVTWWSAIVFANRLSISVGLRPAYDLSGVVFRENTSPEAGNANIKFGAVKFNSINGNICETEGYRLPTTDEYTYVVKGAGVGESLTEFDNPRYMWIPSASLNGTKPVAQLDPLVIGRKGIFDLRGNVSEWSQENAGLACGGSWRDSSLYQQRSWRDTLNTVGFRLVRTLKK